jgi:uncharacterized protein YcaQ
LLYIARDAMKPQHTTSIDMIRRMAVVRQGLHQRPPRVDRAALRQLIHQIGLLQLDSVSVTARSHYLVMLSRAGLYDPADLDSLLADGHLFEYWAHAACLIPIEHYPYFHPFIHHRRQTSQGYYRGMGSDPQATLSHVLDTIRQQGPLSSKDFESRRDGESGWWNWKPAKVALEYLFNHGHLMISHRVSFQRYYDLTERVLDGRGLVLDKSLDDWYRWAVVAGLRHQGAGTTADIADYYRLRKGDAQRVLNQLAQSGELMLLEVEGLRVKVYLHRDDWPLLQAVEAGQHIPRLTTFLSPFDNLLWYRDRIQALFDFFYRVEMYTPQPKRQYGYYVMPILHHGRLVGRIDPRVDRKAGVFSIRALHLEPGVEITDDLVEGLVGAVREFMAFHACQDFMLEQAHTDDLRAALLRRF